MDDQQKAPWMFMGKTASQQYEQAKSRRDKKDSLLPKTGPAHGSKKTAAVQATATTNAAAVSKTKVKPSVCL